MPKIEELYAYVIEDAGPDDEGIPAFMVGDTWWPMIGADMKRADEIRPHAQLAANIKGKKVTLIHSTGLEVIETLEPQEGW